MTMEKKIKIGLIGFLLAGIILATGTASAVMEAPIQDSGTFEVTVQDVFSVPGNMTWTEAKEKGYSFPGSYVKIRINKIIAYSRDLRADYDSLSVGDELEAIFLLGMIDLDTQEAKLVVKGDILRIEMHNQCRIEEDNPCRRWKIFQYDIIKPLLDVVSLATDKIEYKEGENVNLIIKNNINKEIIICGPSYFVEKFDNGKWTEIKRRVCPCEFNCKLAAYFILQLNETMEYNWDQMETWCTDHTRISKTVSKQVPVGKYRIKALMSHKL